MPGFDPQITWWKETAVPKSCPLIFSQTYRSMCIHAHICISTCTFEHVCTSTPTRTQSNIFLKLKSVTLDYIST